MAENTKAIVDLLKKGHGGINYLAAASGDRHILDVPTGLIDLHDDFVQIRGKDPTDLSLLQSSMKETEGPLYMPCLYAEFHGEQLKLFVVDGHQRLASAKVNHNKTIVCQYVSRWDTAQKAFREAVGVQWAHYEPTEADVVSILRSGKLTQAEIASKTGLTESKVSRLAKVADEDLAWLYGAVKDGIIGLGMAGKLVDACNKNGDKLTALKNTFVAKREMAEEQRLYWENHMKSRKRKWDKRTKDKAKIATYYKGFDWNPWVDALDADEGIVEVNGVPCLDLDETTTATKSGVRIGDVSEWKKEFAIYGLFEKKIDEVDEEDIGYVLERWDYLREVLTAIRDGESIPSLNPTKMIPAPPPPTSQKPRMKVGGTTPSEN